MTDAFNTEAAQLQDAELDVRIGARGFSNVFGNGLFECANSECSPSASPKVGGPVKMNNLFSDAKKVCFKGCF